MFVEGDIIAVAGVLCRVVKTFDCWPSDPLIPGPLCRGIQVERLTDSKRAVIIDEEDESERAA